MEGQGGMEVVTEDSGLRRLARIWQGLEPAGPVRAYQLRSLYYDRWVRFHSLPGSKRYADDEAQYATLLGRYNTVLGELFGGGEAYVVTAHWSSLAPEADASGEDVSGSRQWAAHRRSLHPEGAEWLTLDDTEGSDPDDHTRWHFFADLRPWQDGCVDALLRAVADDTVGGMFVTDPDLRRMYAPYDGGADVILADADERDALRRRHAAWLPQNSAGL